MIPENEPLISLKSVPKLPIISSWREGRGVPVVTIYRWARFGVRGFKLETSRIGLRIATSEAALNRFIQKISDGTTATLIPPKNARDAEVDKTVELLRRELAPAPRGKNNGNANPTTSPYSRLTITRGRRQAIVLIDSAGVELARITVAELTNGRASLAITAKADITIARGEVSHKWEPRHG